MKLVVVGGVAAGLSAASRARKLDPRLEIEVLEKGARISYGACGLPYWIEGQVRSFDELVVFTPEKFERERNVRVRTGCEVTALRHPQREVVLASGERVRYDRLVWATGARPVRWSGPRCFSLHTDTDAAALQAFLSSRAPGRAAVVGGGYIGLEMATALRARGWRVALYEENPNLLGRDCVALTELIKAELERAGVEVRTGTRVEGPETLTEDLIVPALGLTPNVVIAREGGIEVGRTGAIAVDERQETNLQGVFAAGDCAEALHRVTGRPAWIPLGTTANKTGRVAGANAAGRRERFAGIAGTSIVRVGGLGIGLTGLSEPQARREGFQPVSVRISAREKPKYFWGRTVDVILVADRLTGRLLGGGVFGEQGVAGRINTIATALTARLTVDDFAQLDLAYAPPYADVHDPLLIAAQQLQKALIN